MVERTKDPAAQAGEVKINGDERPKVSWGKTL
jgi:hypothetical protein